MTYEESLEGVELLREVHNAVPLSLDEFAAMECARFLEKLEGMELTEDFLYHTAYSVFVVGYTRGVMDEQDSGKG